MDSSDIVAIVALIVSVIALIGTILQLLQQYFSSAEGYKNCGQQVMGDWSLTRKRRFRVTELRFETQFETPVIFMCPPDNTRGPLGAKGPNTPLWHIQGTPESERDTKTPSVEKENADKNKLRGSKKLNEDVHTADNERANWYILLQALHAMERVSQGWQDEKLAADKTAVGPKRIGELPEHVAPWQEHSVVAAIQPKRKSWDVMPSEIKKPYATTAMCHMIEMAAMLGLHWREFDRSQNKYHAEGNGYLLTGHEVDDLGIMFTFQIYAQNAFGQHRIIPNEEIKLLAFGNVSTIYRPVPPGGTGKIPYDIEDPKNTGVLQFGNTTELAESLTHYGCNSKTTNYFRDDKKKHGHLFPVVFEVLGMVAKSVYIPNTYYRFLPNPTTFSWNRKNFSLRKLLLEFHRSLKEDENLSPLTEHLQAVLDWSDELAAHLKNWPNEDDFSLVLLSCLHRSIERCDKYLAPADNKAREAKSRMVKLVVREHVQEVMKMLNEPTTNHTNTNTSSTHPVSPRAQSHHEDEDSSLLSSSAAFEDLNSAAPEVRNAKLMEIYFTTVLRNVMVNCPEVLKKRTTTPYVPSVASRTDLTSMVGETNAADDDSSSNTDVSPAARSQTLTLSVPGGPGTPGVEVSDKVRRLQERHQEETADIWCTLMFRMLCWLLLHDFHKKDVQISKSELYGSRLPVYIA
ncbi:hypothetical protein M406DRAFT_65007 [Cryphonectria parasitica EP155]|uniref:Modin n=1 Tax=Cryphonectria parasitica (strain ATCC 38755 / EP155) TaxID=660469 RepID=A0A9P4XVU5_CRYP1|nr:uncharacterized protein M406DRAFT_65007 [Cryphonectria parasitica EP155]KAF3761938.1 hypothetical protein M406DRAFT_65007 [Cryphonectria parasitica EP155]